MKKKRFLAWISNGNQLNLKTHEFIIQKLSQNFDKIYYINIFNLNFFENKKPKNVNRQENMPYNLIYYEPKSFFQFKNFLKDKKLIAINNFGKDYEDLKKHFILNLLDIDFVQISNIGNIQWSFRNENEEAIELIKFKLSKFYTQKLVNFLSNVGLVPKIQIRFLSNIQIIENIKKNKLKNLFLKLNLFHAKELILVNSRSHDQFIENKITLSEDFIVLLDYDFNHPDDIASGSRYTEKNINLHYKKLRSLLDNLSKKFNKKVIITVHPRSNLDEKKKLFPNYEIVKFRTSEFISKAFLVLFFDSSAVVDAILQKKKIITLISNNLGRLSKDGSNKYSDSVGIYQVILDEIDNSQIDKMVSETEKRIPLFDNYINQNISIDGKYPGYKKIIDTIKKRFFDQNES
jgi:hypothetical protein